MAITTDGWTARTNDSYVTITAHFIDDEWKYHSFVLSTLTMSEKHTAENLAAFLKEEFENWGILETVCTTDNASNITLAIKKAGFVHIQCFAHTVNLASQAGLKSVNKYLVKVRTLVNW